MIRIPCPYCGERDHSEFGYARQSFEYDEWGNRTLVAYFDAAGLPVSRSDNGIATIHRMYDSDNRLLRVESRAGEGNVIRRQDLGGSDQ